MGIKIFYFTIWSLFFRLRKAMKAFLFYFNDSARFSPLISMEITERLGNDRNLVETIYFISSKKRIVV